MRSVLGHELQRLVGITTYQGQVLNPELASLTSGYVKKYMANYCFWVEAFFVSASFAVCLLFNCWKPTIDCFDMLLRRAMAGRLVGIQAQNVEDTGVIFLHAGMEHISVQQTAISSTVKIDGVPQDE